MNPTRGLEAEASHSPDPFLPNLLKVLAAALIVAAAARCSVTPPGGTVPHTLQTLAVLLVGVGLGKRRGAAALTLYLLLGAAGLPVFADGASGVPVLSGPTGGFLIGFPIATALVGHWSDRDRFNRFLPTAGRMIAAHGLILVCGLLRLSATLGLVAAYKAGVAPFLLAAVLKSLLAASAAIARQRTKPSTL